MVHIEMRIIDQLQIDHRNMRQLLRILEKEMTVYSDGGIPDFDLMQEILDYTLHYPDMIHHPREDLLFRRLLIRDPASKAAVGDLIEEHGKLAELTRRFAAALHNAAHDAELPREWFERLAGNYIAATRQHMATEETTFFPRALAALQDSDMAELDVLTSPVDDPLFGGSIEKRYLDLHRRIADASR